MTNQPSKPPQVPGQFLGYSLQTSECLRQLLLAKPGTIVSVEAFDDVGVESSTGVTAIQTKSALDGNPIADRSPEWWKALANWIRAVETDQLEPLKCSFQLHVFSPKCGHLAELFANADTDTAAKQAVEKARLEFWGTPPTYEKKASVAVHLEPHVTKVLTAAPNVVISVVKHFKLSFGSGITRNDLEELLRSKFVPPNSLGDVLDKALGWVKGRIETAIQTGRLPCIAVDDFLDEIGAFVTKLRFQNILNDFAGQPASTDVEQHGLKVYVSQLHAIEADEDDILQAINSYLRAAVNRSEWSNRFLVYADSFDEYEKALRTHWHNTKKQQDLDHSAEEIEKRGRRLLVECMKLRKPLEGREVPDDFTPGSFHSLADDLVVGWHPDYKAKLKAMR